MKIIITNLHLNTVFNKSLLMLSNLDALFLNQHKLCCYEI